MLKIRLKRVGRKHDPSFRIVVTEKHLGPKSGKYIENVGFYNVLKGEKDIQADRVKYWIEKGAQVSDTVHNLLVSEGVIEGKKKNVLPKKTPILKEKTDSPAEAGEEKKVETEKAPEASATPEEAKEETETEPTPDTSPVVEETPQPETEAELVSTPDDTPVEEKKDETESAEEKKEA